MYTGILKKGLRAEEGPDKALLNYPTVSHHLLSITLQTQHVHMHTTYSTAQAESGLWEMRVINEESVDILPK